MPKLAANNSISDAEALALVMEMMAIPGRSGEEAAIMDFIRGKLIEAGVPQQRILLRRCESPYAARRPSRQPGAETARHDPRPAADALRPRRHGAHLCWFAPGAKGQIRRQRQQGNGARCRRPIRGGNPADDRLAILGSKLPHPPLTFLWTVQEEVGLFGARYVRLSKLGKPRLAFNFDGGAANALKIGATGGYRMTIEIEGLASHAGNHPEEGVSAIAIASLAIADLVKGGWHGLVTKNEGDGTSNVGVIRAARRPTS